MFLLAFRHSGSLSLIVWLVACLLAFGADAVLFYFFFDFFDIAKGRFYAAEEGGGGNLHYFALY